MDFQTSLSTYLVQPRTASSRHSTRNWRARLQYTMRTHSKLLSHTVLVLAAWGALSFSISYLNGTQALPGQTAYVGLTGSATMPQISTDKLTPETPSSALPGGPSGLLLPPGTMAPDRTYANTYARGQCTWYVAGRRPIPKNWGNARTWYYHATASGYKVGTTPAIAAIAWTSAGTYGHVALVEQISADSRSVLVSEMNYRGIGVKSTRWAPASSFKYIY